MGGKKGGGARTPYEAPNTLSSAQRLRIVDAICEGVADGFGHGNEHPLKSVFFNDTPIQNADGSYNFKGVTALFQSGTPDQSYIPGFEGTERTVSVSAAVKKNAPVVRAVTDAAVSRLRVTVGVERNVQVLDNGDSVPAHTELRIELLNDGGVQAMRTVSFTEKGSGAFYHDEVFDSLPAVPFNIRVSRITPDSQTDRVTNGTFFASFVAASDAKLCYPNTALAALLIDSDQFGNQVPRRNYLLRGMQVQVPANYDPETRTYDGMWDGSFKTAWTNNPAWVFYDLLTSPRYSTLARRLHAADIDKWSLYQAAQYCDQMVPDGFGGQEPRFVCNAYITDQRQAGELLEDLASVFTGLAVWNGNQVSVLLDQNTDPVAAYGNHNVENGLFTYNSAALKAIHTAVHVRYADKHDAYRSKTEYVAADAETIRRYGLNIKSVTAFGCDSRAQAVRFGQWILQTGLRQQDAVTFTVGREGLKHLPYDIIQVADNDYAGTVLSGRVLAVSGSLITLDREVPADAVKGYLKYTVFVERNGQTVAEIRSLQVASCPAPNQLRLAAPAEGLAEMDGWVLTEKVQPRLYRAVGIKENTEEGTYTITALRHDPAKYGAVDRSARFAETTTLHSEPKLLNGNVQTEGGDWVLTWDNLSADGAVLSYDIKVYRNGKLYRHIPDAATAEVRLQNLPDGDYRAEIRGRNARGKLSAPLVRAWQISYTIGNVRATPKLFAVGLDWHLPPLPATVHTEIWYAPENDRNQAAKLAALPYPQSEYTLNGVKLADRYWFWLRITDDQGRSGEWTAAVQGVCDTDPSPIVGLIQGQITENAFSQALIDNLNGRFAATEQKAARELLGKAQALGNKIQTLENIDAGQALQINTLTAAQNAAAAALEQEKQARIAGDQAEATARQTLAAQHGQTAAAVTALQQTVANNQQSSATQIEQMRAALNDPDNLCRNPSMRENTAGWIKMAREQDDGQWVGLARQRDQFSDFWVPVNPGDVVYCAMWVKNKGDTHAIGIGVHTQEQTGGDRWIIHQRASTTVEGWQKVENFITVSENAVRMRLMVQIPKAHAVVSPGWLVRDIEWRKVNTLSPVTADIATLRQTLADQQQASAQQAATLRAEITAAKAEMRVVEDGVLDLRRLDTETYYPCVSEPLPASTVARLRIYTNWDDTGGTVWSTHRYKNFILMLDWESNGIAWGAIHQRRVVHAFEHKFANLSPVLGIHQLDRSSREVVWLRGGALYRYQTERGRGFTLHAEGYTQHSQTVSPRTYDANALPQTNEAKLSAGITETRQAVATVEGKVQSIYGLKVEAVGNRKAVAGLTLGADGQTGESQLLLAANKVAFIDPQSQQVVAPVVTTIQNGQAKMGINGDLLVDGTILGRHIRANQAIESPHLHGGSLYIGNGRFTVTSQGQVSISAANGNVGMKLTNEGLKVYDHTGKLKIELGKLT